MDRLRKVFDNLKPRFSSGGKYEKWWVIFDVIENFFYSSSRRTFGLLHIRDSSNVQRIMVTVMAATIPAVIYGMYNIGFQALSGAAEGGGKFTEDWHFIFINLVCNYDPTSFIDCLWFGACYFLPIYAVTFIVAIAWEMLFATIRNHEISEGAFVTTILFALCCPPDVPLWQVAVGISFGIVIGKEIFGGTGKNFLNPALTGRVFLYFAYPTYWSGDSVWTALDGYSSPTILGIGAQEGLNGIQVNYSWFEAFVGSIPGSAGETSTLFILLGLLLLLWTRVASWRIVIGVLIGTLTTSILFNSIGSDTNPMFSVTFIWHMVIGGYTFGLVFMAVEPVTGSHTNILIGIMVVLIRVINPAFPEGMMLAILFANLFSPLIDHYVKESNIKKRLKIQANYE